MTKSILIVEDEAGIAEALRYSLQARKYSARVAITGPEGLSASLDKNDPPALILLDHLLPGMTGLEICRRLRREPSTEKIPIIMVTARTSAQDIENAIAAGVDDYFTKPFSVGRLLERIDALLNRSGVGEQL